MALPQFAALGDPWCLSPSGLPKLVLRVYSVFRGQLAPCSRPSANLPLTFSRPPRDLQLALIPAWDLPSTFLHSSSGLPESLLGRASETAVNSPGFPARNTNGTGREAREPRHARVPQQHGRDDCNKTRVHWRRRERQVQEARDTHQLPRRLHDQGAGSRRGGLPWPRVHA